MNKSPTSRQSFALAFVSVVVSAGLASVAVSMVVPGHGTAHEVADTGRVVVDHQLPACATEDSMNCVWDADVQGNGKGRTFVDIDGVAYYAE